MRFGLGLGVFLSLVILLAGLANAQELQAPPQVDPSIAAVGKQWDLVNSQMVNFLNSIGTLEGTLVATQAVTVKQEAEKATLIEWLKEAQAKNKPDTKVSSPK